MSYISRVGNLASTPVLREGDKGFYCYARVIVSDRLRADDGSYGDGPSVGYDVQVSGDLARQLVATAEESGNVRIHFEGQYRVTEYAPEGGPVRLQHEVKATEVSISLRNQHVVVVPK
ncbi:single-stranded DNA-binding protein [Pseudoclavibacter sp. RFBA6]|uniref:single-stranded DNA-binding protein n=1 Tax=Pseudoclavibacter sp. RFBA6 TaxID=2080573 RepID=UPI000CE8366B|nr:single-stranded DNA-binding protein [Pseudoclavibacter sp. RFBA6]PPG43752.1 single-stranded DNA-binding protein [Pseudoclavibacter sp. RFBA6]